MSDALIALLRGRVLRSAPGQPIVDAQGQPARMIYLWDAVMTADGARLCATAILDRLEHCSSTQIASGGFGALPLLSACVLLANGRFTGLSIRETRKESGSGRRIDGPLERGRSAVLIDDVIGSGGSMVRAIDALEAEGLEVERCIALVDLPWGGGAMRVRGLGYEVETIVDGRELGLFEDRVMTYRDFLPAAFDEVALPEGLHPAILAKQVAAHYLATGRVARPPRTLDAAYDARGGTAVSFRARADNHRLCRGAFWHFDAADADPARDVVLATLAGLAPLSRSEIPPLDELRTAVTFKGPLERITPSGLDPDEYGIVVRSRTGDAAGGALPNMQRVTSAIEQWHHALVNNAGLDPEEPHELYRHRVTKHVEPGADWLPFGAPRVRWADDLRIGEALTRRARHWLDASTAGSAIDDALISAPVFVIVVSLYREGLRGQGVAWDGTLDDCLERATREAAAAVADAGSLAIVVSVLHDQERLGDASGDDVAHLLRPGIDAIAVEGPDRGAIVLPDALVYGNWSRSEQVEHALARAGTPCEFSLLSTESWLDVGGVVRHLDRGFPERGTAPIDLTHRIEMLAGFIARHVGSDGIPIAGYDPIAGTSARSGEAARAVGALWTVLEAGLALDRSEFVVTATRGLDRCCAHLRPHDGGGSTLDLPDCPGSPNADALLLLALLRVTPDGSHPAIPSLGRRVRSLLDAAGRVTDPDGGRGIEPDRDLLPGQVLLALGTLASVDRSILDRRAWSPALRRSTRRFRALHPWGMAGWHPQAWSAIHALDPDPECAALVFEMADHMLDHQLDRDGSFASDFEPSGPGFATGLFVEGIAAAGLLAVRIGDGSRAVRYRIGCERGLGFLDRLIIHGEDTFCMSDPAAAVGGVRSDLAGTYVQIDYVAHALHAVVATLRLSAST